MTLYLRWVHANPTHIICSFRDFAYLGGELLGLPLWPYAYCKEGVFLGVNESILLRPSTFLLLKNP